MTIAAYGQGTYTHQLAQRLSAGSEVVLYQNPAEVIAAVAAGDTEKGVIPFFNIFAWNEGVPVSYRLLLESQVYVHDVVSMPIALCLAAPSGTTLANIHTIYLMGVLRKQCDNYVATLPSRPVLVSDGFDATPMAFKRAVGEGFGSAAIGPEGAARSAGLDVLAAGIENPGNATFFFVISRTSPTAPGRRLWAVEVDAAVAVGAITQAISPLFPRGSLAYRWWFEDRELRKEVSHFTIIEVDPSPDDTEGVSVLLRSDPVKKCRDIGIRPL